MSIISFPVFACAAIYYEERQHMGDFPKPQQKYAGTGGNGNFEIAVILSSEIKTLWKLLCILFGCVSTQISNLRAKINLSNMLKKIAQSNIYGRCM